MNRHEGRRMRANGREGPEARLSEAKTAPEATAMESLTSGLHVDVIVLVAAVCLLGSMCYSAEPDVPKGKKWKLVWSDEFNGTTLDESKWTSHTYKVFGGWVTKDAVYLDGRGNLVIKTYEKDGKYYGGCIGTKGKFQHKYGYWVARCKLSRERGHFPAFWIWAPLLQPGIPEKDMDPAKRGTEIDVMEYFFSPSSGKHKVHHNLHWIVDRKGKKRQSAGHKADLPGVSEGYHTFAVEWTPKEYVFYVDGKIAWRTTKAVSHVEQYACLSDHIAEGAWTGRIQDAKLPDFFLVDYVRVYERAD